MSNSQALSGIEERAKKYLLWRDAGLTICDLSLAPEADETSDPILHINLL
jgi:hypothetical protein